MATHKRNGTAEKPAEKRIRMSLDLTNKHDLLRVIDEARKEFRKVTGGLEMQDIDIVASALRLWGKKKGYLNAQPD